MESILVYHAQAKWFCRAYVIMPDHLHLLIQLPLGVSLAKLMQNWKRYTTRTLALHWQDNFFDRRLRQDESVEEKSWYMALNPVRAGLVREPSEWKWFGFGQETSCPR
ncbi:MAG: transposase [Verrucomicrobiae bacterium]|nr:transposase [Verrucomicrobiae bacterium]